MRLNQHTVIPAAVSPPRYPRQHHGAGIVHLGLGAFHRGHQAWYTEEVLNRFGGNWRIIGVSLRSDTVYQQLVPQDCLYTLEVRHGQQRQRQLIGALADVIVAPAQPERVIAALADQATQVVTLTITEKGYCLSASSGELDSALPAVQHDVNNPAAPQTALGFLCAGLAARRAQDLPGLTIISCDNIANNGDKLRRAVLTFSQLIDPTLASWIDRHCRFPATMVDRIVPASTEADLDGLAAAVGYRDQAAVFTEAFQQWVIEDRFAGPVPPWNKVGAAFVADVAPFETMKLRLLNASHSAIAYFGMLTGAQTVDEVMAQPVMRRAISSLMAEAEPTLDLPLDFDVTAYRQQLLTRFDNSALGHRCQQIAMDGSQKLPNRIVPILQWQLDNDGAVTMTCAVLAAWCQYLLGLDERARPYNIDDPAADALAARLRDSGGEPAKMTAIFLEHGGILPESIAADPRVARGIQHWLTEFGERGIIAALDSQT